MAKRIKYHSLATGIVALAAIDKHVVNLASIPGAGLLNEVANRVGSQLPVMNTPLGAIATVVATGMGSKVASGMSPHLGSKALGHGIKI